MKVVIVNAFARGNRGDAALLSVAIRQVRQAYPGAEISIAGFEHPDLWPTFDDIPNLGSVRRYVGDEQVGRPTRIARKTLALLIALLAALPGGRRPIRLLARLLPTEMRREVQAVTRADLVLSLGGGYLNGRADFASDLSIGFLLLPLLLAQRFGVPVVLAPQSFGPFPTRWQRAAIRRVLRASRRVVVREPISLDRLAEAGLTGSQLMRGVDSAFAFRGRSRRPWRRELGIPEDATLILMTARQYLGSAAQAEYERAMVAAIRDVLGRENCHVALVPQVTCGFQDDDDRIVNARLARTVADSRLLVLDDPLLDHHDVFALYACADFIIGTRFHSVIFGLIAEVPCLAVEYDHKTGGIMAELGLDEWVIPMAGARAEPMVDLVGKLLANGDSYRQHLKTVIPPYAAGADEFVELLRADVPEPVSR